ncbi:hypothetical protein HCJ96_14790 [Alteromonas sp. MYP5]|uniref:FlgO domain-containing protein n=2 Tax=Alteromonas ponticola TaxID=2720613 RepID=A0ABX1R4C5_9ALTE|nr:hypothetical protein [Alteromonas ponticola]
MVDGNSAETQQTSTRDPQQKTASHETTLAEQTARSEPSEKSASSPAVKEAQATPRQHEQRSQPEVANKSYDDSRNQDRDTKARQNKRRKVERDDADYAYQGYQDPLRSGFYPRQTHKKVADYASQLVMQLMDKAMGLNINELVGVTSFVRLNTALTDTTILGNQLAEHLITELQAYGVGVIDFKVTDGISITPHGDIAMSRSGERLAQSVKMDHVLTGTMIEDSRGVRVNARIVNVDSKRVIASASIHIPAFIVTSLYAGQSTAP